MATARQSCEILDETLRLPNSTARWHADRLRGAGHLANNQGRPEQASAGDVALILLSLLLGSPATSASAIVPAYANLRTPGGPTLGDALAGYIEKPEDFFELRLSTIAPAATLIFRAADHGIRTVVYSTDEYYPRPAFERLAILGADSMTRLSAAIASAPPVRVGGRRIADRYRRLEYAIQ